jgi:hypothetical protein
VVEEARLVQPLSPLEQLSVPSDSEMVQAMLEPQVPGQELPQAPGALLNKIATLEVDGQLPDGYNVR